MGGVRPCHICVPVVNRHPRIRQAGAEAHCPIHYNEKEGCNKKEINNPYEIQKKIRKRLPPTMKRHYKKKIP